MIITKLNETFSKISGTKQELNRIIEKLKVEEAGAYFNPLVKRGFKSPFVYFTEKIGNDILVYNGHLHLIGKDENLQSDYTLNDIKQYLQDVIKIIPFKPYDFQLKCFIKSILNVKHINLMCTGSGKSLTISLLLDFFMKHNKRCVLLVPNINLLTQFKNDIKSYNLNELYDNCDVLGAGNTTDFKSKILISTWQSLINYKEQLGRTIDFDVLINDEVHKNSGEVSSEIAQSLVNTKYRFGFTGTLPEDEILLYRMIGLFGKNTRFVTSRELIDRGLGTPININSLFLDYNQEIKNSIRNAKNWAQKLKIIKEYGPRNNLIENLSLKLMNKNENTLVLFSHTEHGKTLFIETMKKLFPKIKIENYQITGKRSFEFQKQYGIYFLNGEDDAKTRELTRKILEEQYVEFDKDGKKFRVLESELENYGNVENVKHVGSILISPYQILSTGVNIRQLHNVIFASPLKAYTTITQSIGRGMRLHPSKKVFNVFDLVDNTGLKKVSGIFYKQYVHRFSTSYNPEGYNIKEKYFKI